MSSENATTGVDLDALQAFVRVAELGTFSAAARQAGVPKSTMSRRVARLEDQLGVELMRRGPRSFRLTDDGQALYERSQRALSELLDAVRALAEHGDEPRGTLVVTAPPDLGTTRPVLDLLARYSQQCPKVMLEVRLLDRMVDLRAEGVDIAIRAHGGVIPGSASLMSRPIGRLNSRIYASAAYVSRYGEPEEPSALSHHRFIAHSSFREKTFQMTHASGVTFDLELPPVVLHGNSMSFLRELALRGLGLVLLPVIFGLGHAQETELRPVLPGWSTETGQVTLVWPASRHLAPAVRRFVELARGLVIDSP